MCKKIVIIVGAGFSKGICNFPVDKDFFKFNKDNILKNEEYCFLKKAIEINYGCKINTEGFLEDLSLENVWDSFLYEIYNPKPTVWKKTDSEDFLSKWDNKCDDEKELAHKIYRWYRFYDHMPRREVTYLYILAEWELKKLVLQTYNKLPDEKDIKFIKETIEKYISLNKNNEYQIISFNYDLLIDEFIFNYFGIHNITDRQWFYEDDANKFWKDDCKFRIIKPHGSLSWKRILLSNDGLKFTHDNIERLSPVLKIDEIGVNEFQEKEIYKYCYVEPGLLPLLYEKDLYSNHFIAHKDYEVINNDSKNMFFGVQHRMINESLSVCDKVLILGYSFPLADNFITGTFVESKRNRDVNKPIKKVDLVIKEDSNKESFFKKKLVETFLIDEDNITINLEGIKRA